MDIIGLIKYAFVKGANDGSYSATALVYDVLIAVSADEENRDAIAVSLNHQDGYSVIVIFPYRLQAGDVIFDEALDQAGEADIFRRNPFTKRRANGRFLAQQRLPALQTNAEH